MKSHLFLIAALVLSGCQTASFEKDLPPITPVQRNLEAPSLEAAEAMLKESRFSEAAAAFRKLTAVDPQSERARFGLAETLRKSGRPELSIPEYLKLVSGGAYRVPALEGMGLAHLVSGEHNSAYETFNLAVAEDASAWKAWLGLAQLRDIGRDWERADEAYANALSSTGAPALVLNNQGVSMLARGDAKAAAELFRRAATIDPSLANSFTNLDLASANAGAAEIIARYTREPDARLRAQRLNNAGYVAMLQDRHSDAEALFNAAIEAHPSYYALAYDNLQTLKSMESK